jgi:hypothetical protein
MWPQESDKFCFFVTDVLNLTNQLNSGEPFSPVQCLEVRPGPTLEVLHFQHRALALLG